MQTVTARDIGFMRRAVCLARRGLGRVHPNPLVGAVLVKDNRIIGEGAHERFGGPHAEAVAIGKARVSPRGATLYVTLEPCAHFGKTPPCTDLVLMNKIGKVVIGTTDPNPLVSGRGIRRLKKAGIRVVRNVLVRECDDLNKDFFHWVRTGRPYVTVKAAESLDGKIATWTGDSRWITESRARVFAHGLRAVSDAVLVGAGTVLRDNPRLNVRWPRIKRSFHPVRVILDSRLKTPLNARMFSKTSQGPVILATTQKASRRLREKFAGKAEILTVEERNGRVDLKALLKRLGRRGFVRVLIEGGGEVIAEAFERRCVNEVYFMIAPKIIGGKNAVSAVGGDGVRFLKNAVPIGKMTARFIGRDLLVHGVI